MAMYRKTALVSAEQFLPGEDKIPAGVRSSGMGDPRKGGDFDWVLDTLEGTHTLRGGDYICTGPAGERWNVACEIFEATYELATEARATASEARAESLSKDLVDMTDEANGWEIRALRSEARAARLEEAVTEAIDLLMERTHGNPARSAGHNARLCLQSALSTQPTKPEGEEQ